jgi:hypothetical protein
VCVANVNDQLACRVVADSCVARETPTIPNGKMSTDRSFFDLGWQAQKEQMKAKKNHTHWDGCRGGQHQGPGRGALVWLKNISRPKKAGPYRKSQRRPSCFWERSSCSKKCLDGL